MKPQSSSLPTPEEVEASTDIIFDFPLGGRRVVGQDNDMVVKYGRNIDLDESNSISFVQQNTPLPVPTILGKYIYIRVDKLYFQRQCKSWSPKNFFGRKTDSQFKKKGILPTA